MSIQGKWSSIWTEDVDCSTDYDSYKLEYKGKTFFFNVHEQKEYIIADTWDDAECSDKWYKSEFEVKEAIDTGDYSKFGKPFKYTKVEVTDEDGNIFRLSLFVSVVEESIIYKDDKVHDIVEEYVTKFLQENFTKKCTFVILY